MTITRPRIALAANRQIGLEVLRLLLDRGVRPVALLLAEGAMADESSQAMVQLVPGAPISHGKAFRSPKGVEALRCRELDYILSIHFPHIIPKRVLDIPRIGTLNLHPSYLPLNRGWHTPTWAIADGTAYGATLHWIDGGLDTGDIAMQREVEVLPDDTADSLYQRVLAVEVELMKEAIPRLLDGSLPRSPQAAEATEHRQTDILQLQQLRLADVMSVEALLRRLRALTTDRLAEAAYFEKNGTRYRVRIEVVEEPRAVVAKAA